MKVPPARKSPRARLTAAPPPASAGRVAALLFVGLLAVYCANLRVLASGDSLPTRVLPFSILREGNLDLNEFTWERRRDGRLPYYLRGTGKHLYSVSPIATPLVVTPLYIVPAWILARHDIAYDDVRARLLIVVMERLSAATLTALSAVVLFLTLDALVSRRRALALTIVYGLGTSAWSISSQALWPHALAALALSFLCWVFLTPERGRAAYVLAGLAAALAVSGRPPMVVFALLALWHVWRTQRRHALAFVVLPVLGAAALLAYNFSVFRAATGGYSGVRFSWSVPSGIAGLLVSPNRGLFIYTPIMLFAVWGAVRAWRDEARPWMRLLVVGLAVHIVIYAGFDEWWAGYTFGPRYFADVLPALTVLLSVGLFSVWHLQAVRLLAVALAVYGIAVQAVGVYLDDDDWNRNPMPLELEPARVWDWSDLQIARALGAPWKGTELALLLAGVARDPGRPVLLAPLAASDLAADIEKSGGPSRMRPGETREVVLRVTNRGNQPWPSFSGYGHMYSRHLVVLVARWLYDGVPLPAMGDVAKLPENLAPGETLEIPIRLTAPRRPAVYEIDVHVSQALDGESGVAGPNTHTFRMRVE